MKVIVCTKTSYGIRLGAWDFLLWEHITPIMKDGKPIAAKNKHMQVIEKSISPS